MTDINVKALGAAGDGIADDTCFFEKALKEYSKIIIPSGVYKITKTLKVQSNTFIEASPAARVFLDGETPKKRGDFLLANSDELSGNENITLSGGVWDGNNTGKCNVKADLFDKNGFSGTVINFCNVKNLEISNVVVANSSAYNIRLSKVDGFICSNISFLSDEARLNQDGIHLGGFVTNGKIKDVFALSCGQTNDDLIALNADDSVERVENLDIFRGEISNIEIENIFAQDCHTLIRMLSVTAPIRNIKIKNAVGGCRVNAINMDCARGCRVPLFEDEEFPNGAGVIENVEIDGLKVWLTEQAWDATALIKAQSNMNAFKIKNFKRELSLDKKPEYNTIEINKIAKTNVTADGAAFLIDGVNDKKVIQNFENIEFNRA